MLTNSLFLSPLHLLGALLEPSLPSRLEREETINTPLWGGLVGPLQPVVEIHA